MRVNLPATELSSPLATADTKTPDKAGGASFAALHAESLAKLSTVSDRKSATARAATEPEDRTSTRPTDSKAPPRRSETYRPVEGQRYEEIVSGPRNGMFVNRSGNQRDGEAFVLVKRNGREFHIYGSGADRQVVPIAKGDKPSSTSATGGEQTVKGTTYRDVPGRAFDEIVSGPRNGMFVNRSGNARDGKAFLLVKRPDHELHIYGRGENRLVVRVVPPELRKGADVAPTAPATEPTVPVTTPAAEAPTRTPVTGAPSSGSSVLLS